MHEITCLFVLMNSIFSCTVLFGNNVNTMSLLLTYTYLLCVLIGSYVNIYAHTLQNMVAVSILVSVCVTRATQGPCARLMKMYVAIRVHANTVVHVAIMVPMTTRVPVPRPSREQTVKLMLMSVRPNLVLMEEHAQLVF